jgi:hypothetical protein
VWLSGGMKSCRGPRDKSSLSDISSTTNLAGSYPLLNSRLRDEKKVPSHISYGVVTFKKMLIYFGYLGSLNESFISYSII